MSLRSFNRNREREPAAFAHFAFHPDAPPVFLYQMLGDRETQSGPFADTLGRVAYLVKPVEDCLVLGRRDPNAGIGDRNFEAAVPDGSFNADTPAFRSEFDGVA